VAGGTAAAGVGVGATVVAARLFRSCYQLHAQPCPYQNDVVLYDHMPSPRTRCSLGQEMQLARTRDVACRRPSVLRSAFRGTASVPRSHITPTHWDSVATTHHDRAQE
jgi:hypothetical protein